jgi:DNA adenine methylase|tara:strand:+ start:38 stop:895 length:858 start_codon:yes stop_codon:yes gene_type:complete
MLSYIGGKSSISKWIIPFIPKDIKTYVENFSGMYWVFLKMNIEDYPNLEKVVYNDFNKLNVNLFKCVSTDHQRLLEACEKVPVQLKRDDGSTTPPECREFFNVSQSEIYSDDFEVPIEPDYELAVKYAYVLSSVFSGANPSGSKFIDLKGKYHSKFTSFMNKLKNPKWQKMFESITVCENMDFQEVTEKYDSPETYVYCDPPYYIVGEGKYYSNHGFGRSDHERLSNCLKSMKGKFSLSYYEFDLLHEWFPTNEYRWEKKEFHKAAAAKKGETQPKATELLIMNY